MNIQEEFLKTQVLLPSLTGIVGIGSLRYLRNVRQCGQCWGALGGLKASLWWTYWVANFAKIAARSDENSHSRCAVELDVATPWIAIVGGCLVTASINWIEPLFIIETCIFPPCKLKRRYVILHNHWPCQKRYCISVDFMVMTCAGLAAQQVIVLVGIQNHANLAGIAGTLGTATSSCSNSMSSIELCCSSYVRTLTMDLQHAAYMYGCGCTASVASTWSQRGSAGSPL